MSCKQVAPLTTTPTDHHSPTHSPHRRLVRALRLPRQDQARLRLQNLPSRQQHRLHRHRHRVPRRLQHHRRPAPLLRQRRWRPPTHRNLRADLRLHLGRPSLDVPRHAVRRRKHPQRHVVRLPRRRTQPHRQLDATARLGVAARGQLERHGVVSQRVDEGVHAGSPGFHGGC